MQKNPALFCKKMPGFFYVMNKNYYVIIQKIESLYKIHKIVKCWDILSKGFAKVINIKSREKSGKKVGFCNLSTLST